MNSEQPRTTNPRTKQPLPMMNLTPYVSHAPTADDTVGVGTATTTRPAPPRVDRMPLWKVLLHNDDRNEMGYVVETILELTAIAPHLALIKMLEAHKRGVSLLTTAHREYAELLQEQFASKGLTVTIEPDR